MSTKVVSTAELIKKEDKLLHKLVVLTWIWFFLQVFYMLFLMDLILYPFIICVLLNV